MIDRPPAGAGRDNNKPRAFIAPPISNATDERPAGVRSPNDNAHLEIERVVLNALSVLNDLMAEEAVDPLADLDAEISRWIKEMRDQPDIETMVLEAIFETEDDRSPNLGLSSIATLKALETPIMQGVRAPSQVHKNDLAEVTSVIKGRNPLSPAPSAEPRKTKRQQAKDDAAERKKARAEARKAKEKAERQAKSEKAGKIETARFQHGRRYISDDAVFPIEHRTLPHWHQLNEGGKALAAFDYMASTGRPFYAVSLELDDKTRAKAEAAPSFLRYMHDRVVRQLAKRFPGPPRDFVLAAEVRTKTGDRSHIHALIQFDREEEYLVTPALEDAGGTGFVQKRHGDRQVDYSGFRVPDRYWLSYGLKDAAYTKRRLKGSVISTTTAVRRGSEEAFETWRARELTELSSGTP